MPDVWAQRPKAYGVYGAIDTSKLCDGWSGHGVERWNVRGVDDVAREPQGNQPTSRAGSCITSGSPTSTHIVLLQLLARNGGYLFPSFKMTDSVPIDRTLVVSQINEILTEGREMRLTFPQDGKNGDEAVSPWQVRIPIRLFALLLPFPPPKLKLIAAKSPVDNYLMLAGQKV
ncbi:uncharacterized protein BO88DRAFT_481154 [Aspergillus vadensis CBS 113365]|uniref:Uncharacterized protein n=1 Tax=Aspergillus vadensis (strain CBS 113365 / IMI 142717 / IBT 24658) TaxID=1448311 RepID=A0A319BGA8_ASPVC|nr:hypothetical protein BO88DRAFT_481154 [Aspergillus vadensis CBS 113365]PYH69840.1 hypothetical protein BO88DRAFT_481154 [Aspergillus vadensis CBS 113365]